MTKWQPESIPDQDRLFMRVHVKTWVRDGEVRPGAFQNRPEGAPGMSTDWERYSSAEETRQRARKPLEQGVIAFRAGASAGTTRSGGSAHAAGRQRGPH
jgi:hypothetical protein